MNEGLIQDIQGTKLFIRTEGGGTKEIALGSIFDINEQALSSEFASQASLYAYFSVLAVRADDVLAKASFDKEQEFALASLSYREAAEKSDKKATEGSIQAQVNADEAYTKKVSAETSAKYDARLLKALVSALEQRANMLISMGAMLRHEAEMTGMNMKERVYEKSIEDAKKVLSEKKNLE